MPANDDLSLPEDPEKLYQVVKDGEPHTEEFEQAAENLGYREAVEVPVAVMDNWENSGLGQSLSGRSSVLATDRKDWSAPVANIISPDVDPEVVELLMDDQRFDQYVVRLNTASKPEGEVVDSLIHDDFFTSVNPYTLHNTTCRSKDWFLTNFWNERLPLKPGVDLSEVLMNGTDWLEELWDVKEFVIMPPENAGGYGIKETDSAGVVDYVRNVEDGQDIIDAYRAMGHANSLGRNLDIRVEPSFPVVGDIRGFIDAEGVKTAYIRYGPEDDFRCNISQIEADNRYDRLLKVLEEDRAEIYTQKDEKGLKTLPPAVEKLLADTGELLDHGFVENPDALFIGADVLVMEREALEIFPEELRDSVEEYADDDHVYVLSEIHGTGAGGPLRYFHDNLEELPVLFEYQKLYEIAGLDPASPDQIRQTSHPLHGRIHQHYDDPHQAAHWAHETP